MPVFITNIVKYALIAGFMLLAIACGGDRNTPPGDLPLAEEQLADVLVDIHILEARLEKVRLTPKELFEPVMISYQEIYDSHGISKEDYQETLAYYERNPKDFERLYELVIVKLSKKEAELSARIKKNPPAKPKAEPVPKE